MERCLERSARATPGPLLPARAGPTGQEPGSSKRTARGGGNRGEGCFRGSGPGQFARVRIWLPFCLFLGVSGCAVGPDFKTPEAPPVTRYTQGAEPTETLSAEGQSQHFERGMEIAAEWWRLFRSEPLDEVIAAALEGNQDLLAAQATLRQSQENLRAGYGAFVPQIDGNFDTTRQKFTAARFGGNFATNIFTVYTAAVTVTYEIDVFGGQRRALEGLKAQTDYQRYEVQATYLTLLGNVVNTTIGQAAYRAQIEATEEMVALLRDQLRITEAQAKAGMIPYTNVLSVRTQLAATEASLPPLLQGLAKGSHLLATLVGRMPADWTPAAVALADFSLPTPLPVSLPSALVRQRPDILAAEAMLHSASANIGVATAAMLPAVTLSGSYGQSSNSLDTLFQGMSNYWTLGGNLAASLFHGGTLWFQRKAALEAYQASLASYRQTVLGAFGQVADSLRALENDAKRLEAESRALDSAGQALRVVDSSYKAGITSYIQLLIANLQYNQARIGYLQARAQRLQDTAALFIALGGGWWNAQDHGDGGPLP